MSGLAALWLLYSLPLLGLVVVYGVQVALRAFVERRKRASTGRPA